MTTDLLVRVLVTSTVGFFVSWVCYENTRRQWVGAACEWVGRLFVTVFVAACLGLIWTVGR